MDCTNCGAPLPPKSNICTFCSTLNDTDLRARRVVKGPRIDRSCPRCRTRMRSVDLQGGGGLFIERCDTCLGIFFDRDELETVLGDSTAPVREIDLERLSRIVEEEAISDHGGPVVYLSCPVCSELMHRRNYGARSGVIVDTCKEHGVWLDGGELRQLMKWVQAGGRLYTERRDSEKERERQRSLRSPSVLDARLARADPRSASPPRHQGGGEREGLLVVLDFLRGLLS